jgi:hypothetical protein
MTVHIAWAKLPGKSDLRTKTLRGFVMDYNGRMLAMLEKDSPPKQKKEFKPEFTIVPARWNSALQQMGSAQAWTLAMMILDESFKLKQFRRKREVVLSSKMTNNMSHSTRIWIAKKLEQHGLIKIIGGGQGKTLRVIALL